MGLPRPERVGPADVRPSGHDRLAVCEILTCQISVCGMCLGGTVTCQALCVHTVPVCDRDPLEDVCTTAGGSGPESLFHFLTGLRCCEECVCHGTASASVSAVWWLYILQDVFV